MKYYYHIIEATDIRFYARAIGFEYKCDEIGWVSVRVESANSVVIVELLE